MLDLLRTNRELRWVFCAQVVSFLGDWFVFVALAGYIDDATGSEILVSLVLVSLSLPSFLASPLAGPVVDRVRPPAPARRGQPAPGVSPPAACCC